MTPVSFAGCFGWLHSGPSARGVVICGAQGEEEMVSHRALMLFAEQLSDRGLPTLRFDYRGTGDSSEDDLAPSRLAAWRDSVVDAASFLRDRTGVTEIALVGLGLGGLLAVLAADKIAALGSIVLLAPPVSGTSYLREMQMRSKLYDVYESRFTRRDFIQARPIQDLSGGGDVELLGMIFLAETIKNIQGVDLLDTVVPPAPRMLVLKHPRRVSDNQLVAHFRGLGCQVDDEDFVDYTPLMRGPAEGRYPAASFERVVEWLSNLALSHLALSHLAPAARTGDNAIAWLRGTAPTGIGLAGMAETPMFLGPGDEMFGILCAPDVPRADLPVVVILNTWWHHHIGIGRLSVTLSRHFAADDYTSFRFDLSGTGDSALPPEGERAPYLQGPAVGDLRTALDHLERLGHRAFVLIGVCWGANLAAHGSARDPRVVGQVLVNMPHLKEEMGVHFNPPDMELDTLIVLSGCDPTVPEILELGLDRSPPPYDHVSVALINDADHSFRYRADREELIATIGRHLPWLHRAMARPALLSEPVIPDQAGIDARPGIRRRTAS